MFSENKKALIFLFFGLIFSIHGGAQIDSADKENEAALKNGIELLKRYFNGQDTWHVTQPKIGNDVRGLIHFIEDEPIDSVLSDLDDAAKDSVLNFVFRLPENVSDSLDVPGFYPAQKLDKEMERIGLELQSEYQEKEITVPLSLITNIEENVSLLDSANAVRLFQDSVFVFPDSLQVPEVIPDSMIKSGDDFYRFFQIDSLREAFIQEKRFAYNDSIISFYRDSVVQQYAQEQFEEEYRFRTKRFADSIQLNNYQVLKSYNDSIIREVNDSIYSVIFALSEYADYIDTTKLFLSNLANDKTSIVLSNYDQNFERLWLKNEQNDSLSILVKNLDKNGMQFSIGEGVTFSRFRAKKTKDFDFSTLTIKEDGLTGVGKRYDVNTPWRIGGDGTVGLTQTYVENWKKGGKSALSFLMVLKGFANYSSSTGKIKWENSGEIRNGWIKQGQEELQKNDDKFELTSRFGVSAFKKWYYSAELNYETQLFKGYRYPRADNPDPISAFMAPARTFFKLGLDYKPNKNFSLLLSPLTLKNVYVSDTVKIDQTKFGIDADAKSFWEPGLNADLRFKKELSDDISYETKYKMFINYNEPFRKYDINWENLLVMKLNDHINFRLMVHLIYDDDVLFPVYDINGNKTGKEEPKLQVKELITVGFSYKINRNVMRTRRLP